MNEKEARAKIDELTKQAHALIDQAEKVADEHGLHFSFDVAYGMGGSYRPDPTQVEKWKGKPEDYEIFKNEDGDYQYEYRGDFYEDETGGYWQASSAGC